MTANSYFWITFLGGWFGLHKFLTGKIGWGFLYLFTFGLCGIGWIFDTVSAAMKLSKPACPDPPQSSDTAERKGHFDYPVADFQWPFVVSEIKKLNTLLLSLNCTKKLKMNSKALTPDSYFRYEPFTIKTRKISKCPCMLHACSSVYRGYHASIWYDISDNIQHGDMSISCKKGTYFIDFKSVDQNLIITKVILVTDTKTKKLYHIDRNGNVLTS